jgi:hypothetical protein
MKSSSNWYPVTAHVDHIGFDIDKISVSTVDKFNKGVLTTP